MAPITALTIDGSPVDLTRAIYDVTIVHGRATVTDGPAASSITLGILIPADDDAPLTAFGMSTRITVEAYATPRFTGVVSDARLIHPVTQTARLALTGTGPVADLGLAPVTPTAWPQETSGERAARILTAAGITLAETSGTLEVLALDDGETNALALLTDLARDAGAAVFDAPDGTIVFQDLAARAQSYIGSTWATVTGTWAAAVGAWSEQESPAVAAIVPLPPAAIAYEPSMEQHRADIINRAVVEYGDPVATITEEDTASQAIHKTRSATLRTRLADSAAATLRGEQVIARLAWPRYRLNSVQVLVHELDEPTRALVLALRCGDRVLVQQLRQPSPFESWLGVVEGWTETITVDRWTETEAVETHILTLALSDPRASFATVQWQDITPTRTWDDINPTITWADVTLDTDLAA